MNTKGTIILCFTLISICALAQKGTITMFRVDGLIISKAWYDSLKIERESIVSVRSKNPAEASTAFGSRAANGVAIITTSKSIVFVPSTGTVTSAVTVEEKEKLLSTVTEAMILRMRNLESKKLKEEFGLENSSGGVVVYLKE